MKLSDIHSCKVFYDKLTFIYLEMPKFRKSLDELETHFDKWMYVLRNLYKLDRIPDTLREKVFMKLFEVAEIARFTSEQMQTYVESRKYYWDLNNALDTAFEDGKAEVALNALKEGASDEFVKSITGYDQEKIESLKKKVKRNN